MILKKVISFFVKYKFRFIGVLIGIAAGPWGVLLGLISGFFIEKLMLRKKEDEKLVELIRNPYEAKTKQKIEPFDGALFVATLAVNVAGTVALAVRQMQFCFSDELNTDWQILCSAGFKANNRNSDLLTECLAAKLAKSQNARIVDSIFEMLEALEFGWNEELGNKPSAYLSELLNYKIESNESVQAYRILGVSRDDSLKTIKSVHRKLSRIYHPDMLKDFSPEQKKIAQETFMRIQKAYDFILKEHNLEQAV